MIKGTNLVNGAKAGLFTKWCRHNWLFQGKKIYTPPIPPKIYVYLISYTTNKFQMEPPNSKFKKKKGKEK